MLKCVPFDPAWITSDKLDVKAIYRRPHRDADGETARVDGRTVYDLTGPLPVRRHNDWTAKGFEYVTLADLTSLQAVARFLPTDWREYIQEQRPGRVPGPWNLERYLEGERLTAAMASDELETLVATYGADAVLAIKRQTDPGFVLPAALHSSAAASAQDPVKAAASEKKKARERGSKEPPAA